MKLFNLFLPKQKQQIVTEMQSWTVTWLVYTGWSAETDRFAKVFIKESEADEFRKQLKASAKFTNAWIKTYKSQN